MKQRVVRWILTVSLCVLCGWGLGCGLDRILFHLSYDYVFAPGYCARWGLNWGLFCGAVIGLVDGWKSVELVDWRFWLVHWGMVVTIPVTAVLCGFCQMLHSRWFPVDSATELVTPARHAFCTGLVTGAGWGIVVFLTGMVYLRCRANCIASAQSIMANQLLEESKTN